MDREGNKVSIPRVLGAFFVALLVLGVAFLGGYVVSYLNYQKVSSIENTLKTDILSTRLAGEFLKECHDESFYVFSKQLDETGSLIGILEDRFGKDDENVLNKKREYTLIEIEHFLAVKEYAQLCEKNLDTVLFFYSNERSDEAERIGKILTKLKDDRGNELMVYSFDYNLDMPIITLMRELYGIGVPNTIVINEELVLERVENIREVEEVL